MARYDDLNTNSIGYLTFMSVLLLAVTILLLQALCYNWIDWQEDGKMIKQSYWSSDLAIQQQKDSLKGYSKVQEEVPVEAPKGDGQGKEPPKIEMRKVDRIYIPIDRAKDLLLEEAKAKGKTSTEKATTPST
jgi:hypothetical protein